MSNILQQLVGPGGIHPAVVSGRAGTIAAIQRCYSAIIDLDTAPMSHTLRLVVAREVSTVMGHEAMRAWFDECLADLDVDARDMSAYPALAAYEPLVRTMTSAPADVSEADVRALGTGEEAQLVLLAQVVSYVTYLGRVVWALAPAPGAARGTAPAVRPGDYGTRLRRWQPWLAPVPADGMTAAQEEALRLSGKLAHQSEYFRVLAHDPPSLVERSALYDLVMYAPEGAPFDERELAALQVSMVNGCSYCASVHARRLVTLSDKDVVATALTGGPLDDRLQAVTALAGAVTTGGTDAAAAATHLADAGLDPVAVFDLVNVAAIFAWANRLMQCLGSSAVRAA